MILGAIVYKAGIRASVSRVMKGVEKLERGKTNSPIGCLLLYMKGNPLVNGVWAPN